MFQLFQSFLPLHNPIGFGASDFIELELAAVLVILIVAHARLGGWARRLAGRTGWGSQRETAARQALLRAIAGLLRRMARLAGRARQVPPSQRLCLPAGGFSRCGAEGRRRAAAGAGSPVAMSGTSHHVL